MRQSLIVCTLILSASVLLAAQQQADRPCRQCRQEAGQLSEKMKSNNFTMKSAVELAETECRGEALSAFTEWTDDKQPFFAVYCVGVGRITMIEYDHTGKMVTKEPAIDIPSIHDEKSHRPPPPRPGG